MAINSKWQLRLKATGVTGASLAARLQVTPTALSRGWGRGAPEGYVQAAVEALEIMTPEQREQWLARRTS